jgi:hypothetical protein
VYITGFRLNSEELDEVMEIYFAWVLDNDLDDSMVPFAFFENWFLKLSLRIVKAKEQSNSFDIDASLKPVEISSISETDCLMQ